MMKLLELAEEAASKEVPVNLISEAITPEFEPELGVTSDVPSTFTKREEAILRLETERCNVWSQK